jgi:hypothetical protein
VIHDENTNNKLLVLLILEKLEMPVNEDLLLQMCSIDNGWIPYLYCKQVLNEIIQSGLAAKIDSQGGRPPLISLTSDGRVCLAHFYNDIPLSRQDEVTEFIKKQRMNYRKKQEFVADSFRNNDGSYTVTLKILEIAQTIVDIKLVVPTRAIALSITNSWPDKAPETYRMIYEHLIEN